MQYTGAGIALAKPQMLALQRRIAFCEQGARPMNVLAAIGAACRGVSIAAPSSTAPRLPPRRAAMAQRFFGGSGLVPLTPATTGSNVSEGAGIRPQSSAGVDDSVSLRGY